MAFTNNGGSPTKLTGTSLADVLFELDQASDMYVEGLGGNDVITFSPNGNQVKSTTVYGNDGADTISFTATGGSVSLVNGFVQAAAGNDTVTVQNAVSASTMRGGAGDDTLTLNNTSASIVNGNKGGDTVNVNTGTHANSSIYGGAGNDTINFQATTVLANTVVNGNKGDDTITDNGTTGISSVSASTVFGGAGNDVITLDGGGTGVFTSGDKGTDSITTGAGADTVLGGEGNDTLATAGGADSIVGGAGADTITAGAGNDTVSGGAGADNITLAGGTNRIEFSSADQGVSAASVSAYTTVGIAVSYTNGVEQIAAFVSGTDDINFGLSTGVAAITLTETLGTASAILTAGSLFFVRGSLTANTFTVNSISGSAATGGLIIAGNNNTLLNTLTSQSHAVFMAAAPVAAGDLV